MKEIVDMGINSFKFFMAYKGALMVGDELLLDGLQRCKELGALAMVTCCLAHPAALLTLLPAALLTLLPTGLLTLLPYSPCCLTHPAQMLDKPAYILLRTALIHMAQLL